MDDLGDGTTEAGGFASTDVFAAAGKVTFGSTVTCGVSGTLGAGGLA